MQTEKKLSWLLLIVFSLNLIGCATGTDPQDPYESMNRKIFKFNTKVDKIIYRPVAKTYQKILPNVVQARVTNFFSNFNMIPSTANDALQLNVYQMLMDASRFVVNTTVGIGGLFDPATEINLPKHSNDLGLTLARWGMKHSPYIVIPFMGPSTFRDVIGTAGNPFLTPYPYITPFWISYTAAAIDKINVRAQLLPADKLVDEAFDPYVFVRDAYLQKRQNDINQVLGVTNNNISDTSTNGQDTFVSANGENNNSPPANANTGKDTFVPAGPEENNVTSNAKETATKHAENQVEKKPTVNSIKSKLSHNKHDAQKKIKISHSPKHSKRFIAYC